MLNLTHAQGKKVLGSRIKAARKQKGITQENFADMLDVKDRSTVSKWEQGQTIPELNKIPIICDILGVDTGYLFGEYDVHNLTHTEISKITGLNEQAVDKICSMQIDNYLTGLLDILSLLINHPNLRYFLSLLANDAEGKTDTVTFGNTVLSPDRKAIINSELKDIIIEIASDVRKEYKPNNNRLYYQFLFGLYHEKRISFEQLQEIKAEYDKGNFDYTPDNFRLK